MSVTLQHMQVHMHNHGLEMQRGGRLAKPLHTANFALLTLGAPFALFLSLQRGKSMGCA